MQQHASWEDKKQTLTKRTDQMKESADMKIVRIIGQKT